jgi:hypothetical protein
MILIDSEDEDSNGANNDTDNGVLSLSVNQSGASSSSSASSSSMCAQQQQNDAGGLQSETSMSQDIVRLSNAYKNVTQGLSPLSLSNTDSRANSTSLSTETMDREVEDTATIEKTAELNSELLQK